MRALWIITLTLTGLLAACPRVAPPPSGEGLHAGVTHPWELPGYVQPGGDATAPPDGPAVDGGQVELPAMRGPALNLTDTLDPQVLPGRWLQVCLVATEKMNLIPAAEQDVLELGPTGQALFHNYSNGELVGTQDGRWSKLKPGVISMGFGSEADTQIFAELYSEWFLYIWNYDQQIGMWFARVLDNGDIPPLGSDYDSTRGKLHLNEMINNYFTGTVVGTSTLEVRGFYNAGVVSLRWEDKQNNAGGFAAFEVSAKSGQLAGVWWIDNFTSAPFGGPWQATPPERAPLPEDAAGTSVAGKPAPLDSGSVQTL